MNFTNLFPGSENFTLFIIMQSERDFKLNARRLLRINQRLQILTTGTRLGHMEFCNSAAPTASLQLQLLLPVTYAGRPAQSEASLEVSIR